MPDHAPCDQCNSPIPKGEGYCFYSSAGIGTPGALQETGNMLLCQSCTDQIVNNANWAKKIAPRREITAVEALANPTALISNIQVANAESIITLCKSHGFSPEQAKTKARTGAVMWWVDPERMEPIFAAFWKSAKAHDAPVSEGEPKKWWEFWK